MHNLIHNVLLKREIIEIVGLNGFILGINLANLQTDLSILLTLLSIGYLLWRWRKESKK